MKIDLTNYSIKELVELQGVIGGMINDYKDGYFYICEVRSYGRNWTENWVYNTHTLQELCNKYFGEDGIVDVYSNNPDLSAIENYGDVMFVPSIEDYENWKKYMYIKNGIPSLEKALDEWDNRDNVPFNKRPYFAPIDTREYLAEQKKKLAEFDMSFVAPVRVKRTYDNE